MVKTLLVISICVLLLGAAFAAPNAMGISDRYQVNFSEKLRVANTLIPAGNYEIRHVMEGDNHIMVFRQIGVKNPVEIRAKCTLVTLPKKAAENQTIYEVNAANERVLHELIFRGDLAKHVF